jgi:hypothetical protein
VQVLGALLSPEAALVERGAHDPESPMHGQASVPQHLLDGPEAAFPQ